MANAVMASLANWDLMGLWQKALVHQRPVTFLAPSEMGQTANVTQAWQAKSLGADPLRLAYVLLT
jgi:hypothetical protein